MTDLRFGTLPELEPNHKMFLDRTTVIYGETGTGKSFVVIDILYQLRNYVDQIIVFSPTNRQNRTYSGVVPQAMIHYTITKEILDSLWERQEGLSDVYMRANDPDVLLSLFNRIRNWTGDAQAIIADIDAKLQQREEEVKDTAGDDPGAVALAGSKIEDMRQQYNEMLTLIYKRWITKNYDKFTHMNLSSAEEYSLRLLNLNPCIVVVFDDCTDLLKKFKNHPVIQKIFNQCRHVRVTAIIACHTDKALEPEHKKSAFVSIFTEDLCARAYFTRDSCSMSKEGKQRANDAIKTTFTPAAKHQKLAWIRQDRRFYTFTAAAHGGFTFGSSVFWEYCRTAEIDPRAGLNTNRFAREFA